MKTFIISGNHDSDERLNYGSSLLEKNDMYIYSKYNGKLYKREFTDEYGKINVYLLPFVKASQVKYYFPDEEIDSYDSAVKCIMKNAGIDESERNILVAHQFVIGKGETPQMAGSERVPVANVGLVEQIGTDCFDAFDYVALGHIHSPQRIGRDTIRYSGSLLKYSLSEVNNNKSVPVVTFGEKGEVDIELIPLKPMRDMRHIKGQMKQLLDEVNLKADGVSNEDFMYVTLTDEDKIDNVMSIFQNYYPNTIKIEYDNSHTNEIKNVDISNVSQNKSVEELIEEFYSMVYGTEITEEEMAVMKEVAREAGVINEAN